MLVIDIEPVPDTTDKAYTAYKTVALSRKGLKDPEKIESAKKTVIRDKFALNPLTGKILCCGLMSNVNLDEAPLSSMLEHPFDEKKTSENVKIIYYSIFYEDDEKKLITNILHYMQRYLDNGNRIITYNGNSFDIPFITRRAILNNIPHPDRFPTLAELTNKYAPRHHLDLHQFLNPNYGEFSKLNEWAYLIGATTELASDSNKVYEWYLSNQKDKIINHCLSDIIKTYLLYERVKGWCGVYEYS